MRSSRALMLCLLLMSLTAWPMPAQSITSSTPEQNASEIDPAMWYLGSDVRDMLSQVIAIGQEEIRRTAEEAVKTAVAPLLADKAQLTSERDGYRDSWDAAENRSQRAQAALVWVGLGASMLGIILGAVGAAVFR